MSGCTVDVLRLVFTDCAASWACRCSGDYALDAQPATPAAAALTLHAHSGAHLHDLCPSHVATLLAVRSRALDHCMWSRSADSAAA